MTRARQVLPGRTYLITRRCTQRQLLMRPDEETNNAFVYCLAVSAARYELDVLFSVAMSNHHHTGIYDRRGNYPEFLEYFHRLFAKCQNSLRGRWENFWATEQTSVVRLIDPEDVLRKLVYSVCNPVEAGLVERALQWPGLNSYRPMLERKTLVARRPKHFFRPNGSMPPTAELAFVKPLGFAHLSDDRWLSLVEERVSVREKACRESVVKDQRRFLGVRAVLRQDWSSRPKGNEPRRRMAPQVAAANKWRRIEALQYNRHFSDAYAKARQALLAGIRTVLFPSGTYWLKRFAEIVCEDTPYLPHPS